MIRSHLPLNALRAFEAAARHLSFTGAGLELRVTQTAVSHQVKNLEEILGVRLFRRLPRGLALTEEGQALVPVLNEAFGRIGATLDRFEKGHFREVVTVGVVGTFAAGWLLPRLRSFREAHPFIDLRILTNNNRINLAGDGLDYAIRFGDGLWHGTEATLLMPAPLSPVCAPVMAERLRRPADLAGELLLRSYREDEWQLWFAAAQAIGPATHAVVFDSSVTMAEAIAQGIGVGLLPTAMFSSALASGRLVRPFEIEVHTGSYWLTHLKSRQPSSAMLAFRTWLLASCQSETAQPA